MERIDRIPSGDYIGYYWMSDSVEPVVLGQPDPTLPDRLNNILCSALANPFVVEGRLYDASSRVSVSIRYVDSRYILLRHDVADDLRKAEDKETDSIVIKRYVANRMADRKLVFLQYWREQPDPLCCGMPVLAPAEKVFVGFEPLNANEK